MALAEYYPKFSFSGLIGSAATQSSQLFTGNAGQSRGLLGLRWRLFDFARVDAEVSAARGRNAEQLAAYRQSVLRATRDARARAQAEAARAAIASYRALGGGWNVEGSSADGQG